MKPAFGILDALEGALKPSGIMLRGVAQFGEDEGPELVAGRHARSVVLLGNIGGSIWPAFSAWRDGQPDRGGKDPLDEWSKAIVLPIAGALGATAWFPSDPPYMPFQAWAKQAEGLEASPLGVLIHPEYGLWHGYRAALGFDQEVDAEVSSAEGSPCGQCIDKPCLQTCPADAITLSLFNVSSCRSHLKTGEGRAGCMISGCLARNACPVGGEHAYGPDQLAFHMAALGI